MMARFASRSATAMYRTMGADQLSRAGKELPGTSSASGSCYLSNVSGHLTPIPPPNQPCLTPAMPHLMEISVEHQVRTPK